MKQNRYAEPRLCVGLCQLIACNRFAAAVASAVAAAVISVGGEHSCAVSISSCKLGRFGPTSFGGL